MGGTRTAAIVLALTVGAVTAGAPATAAAGGGKYVEDFEFIRDTVRQKGAAVRVRGLDWRAICDGFEPRFASCATDADHVRNVMELLATLRDAHTGVTRSSVAAEDLPRKFDGIFGSGLWWRFDDGKFVLAGQDASLAGASMPPIGSALLEVRGEPQWLALGRDRARIERWFGTSSDHSLYASLSNALLPFRGSNLAHVLVITPDGATKGYELARFAPSGRGFDVVRAVLPTGIEPAEGAAAGFVEHASGKRIGYLAVTGGMDRASVDRVHAAFDRLRGMDALVLDARTAGGGSDDCAWEIAGRLYPNGEDNGLHGRVEPSGAWQFDGPVVFCQDASMVSSAETLAWAVTEQGRAVSIGRPTGGWGIIPAPFQCPSGLVDFRLGVNARPTPVKRVQTEGAGWPPDVLLPPWFAWREPAKDAPAREGTTDLALDLAAAMACGVSKDEVRASFAALFAGQCDAFAKRFAKHAKAAPWLDAAAAAKRVKERIGVEIKQEIALLNGDDVRCADVASSERRFATASARAKAAGFAKSVETWKALLAARKSEISAQKELLEKLGAREKLEGDERKAFLAKHGKTRVGQFVRDQ